MNDESDTEDEDDGPKGADVKKQPEAPETFQASSKTAATQDASKAEDESLSDWFKVGAKAAEPADESETETESENDSENEDVLVAAEDVAAEDEVDDEDEWVDVPEAGSSKQENSMDVVSSCRNRLSCYADHMCPMQDEEVCHCVVHLVVTNRDDCLQKEPEPEPAKMGEEDAAMEYDQDLIFKHLYVSSSPSA